jgi:hypothetical protein
VRARAAAEGECARRRPRTICRRTAYSTLAPEDMLTRVSEGCNPHNHDFSSKHIRREMFRRERSDSVPPRVTRAGFAKSYVRNSVMP